MDSIKLTDILSYRFLSQIQYAPGGKAAAFVSTLANEEENGYEGRLWLYDGQLRRMTSIGKERSFIWQDENHILFPAVRSTKEKKRSESKDLFTSYYSLDIRGGEAVPAFTLPFTARSIKSIGEGKYIVIGSLDVNYPDFYLMNEEERAQVLKEYKENEDYEVFDEIPFWYNGSGIINKRRSALFLVDTNTMDIRRITAPTVSVVSTTVLDGFVYYTASEYEVVNSRKGTDFCCLDLSTGESRVLRRDNDLYVGDLYTVDGRVLVLATPGEDHGLNENKNVYVMDTETGELTLLRHEEYSMYSSVGSDCRHGGGVSAMAKGDRLYHLTTREGSSHLYALEPDGTSVPVITKDGSIDSFAVCEEKDTALMICMYDGRLQELYEADLKTGAVKRISHFNDEPLADKYVADYAPLTVHSQGYDIGGWVLLPKDFDPEKTYPAILDIHGGPKTVYGPVFYHEMQMWAGMGYFVFFCNPKGGDGRDNDFMDIRGHYGETDYQNLMDFTDAVLAAYPQIDKSRLCVTGGSYGGFMTNWIIGHTDRFAAAASQRSISNWISMFGTTDIGYYFADDQCASTPWVEHDKLWEQSPLKYADKAVTPTLFIHSEQDYRCWLTEGLQMFTALKYHGVEARLCMFRGENHELSRSGKPRHRVRRLEEITNWFESHLK